jgi:ElaB/YqjD/DUF883 family membrane-anchored ribosome-binding protein
MHGDLGTRPHTSESVSELGFYETLERESLQQQDKIYMETRSADEIEETTERLLQELRAVVHDGEELLKSGAQELGEKGMAARERLSAALEAAKKTGRKLEERALAGARATDVLIRENPYQSIGIAFGLGIVLGVLINRR